MQIDKSIPVPKPRRGGSSKWPFRDMDVGDSFLYAWPEDFDGKPDAHQADRWQNRAVSAAKAYRPMKFATRVKRDEGGVRVWRIE